MPQLELITTAKCDQDQNLLECSGGYLSNTGNYIIVYTCPACGINYLLLDGDFIKGAWRILDESEAQKIQLDQVVK